MGDRRTQSNPPGNLRVGAEVGETEAGIGRKLPSDGRTPGTDRDPVIG